MALDVGLAFAVADRAPRSPGLRLEAPVRLLISGSTCSVCDLAGRYPHRLGHLLTPKNRNGMAATLATGLPHACDNGAYRGFEPERFRRLLKRIAGQPRCLFVVCPDVVADARATL